MLAAEHELDPEVEDERDLEGVAERLLAYEDGARFDAVFAWDLLDYFDEALSRAVMRRIGHYCRTGTLIYLIISNREQIPDQPGRFTIVDEQHLRFERVGVGTRDGMRYSPRALERMMPGFRLQHSLSARVRAAGLSVQSRLIGTPSPRDPAPRLPRFSGVAGGSRGAPLRSSVQGRDRADPASMCRVGPM